MCFNIHNASCMQSTGRVNRQEEEEAVKRVGEVKLVKKSRGREREDAIYFSVSWKSGNSLAGEQVHLEIGLPVCN